MPLDTKTTAISRTDDRLIQLAALALLGFHCSQGIARDPFFWAEDGGSSGGGLLDVLIVIPITIYFIFKWGENVIEGSSRMWPFALFFGGLGYFFAGSNRIMIQLFGWLIFGLIEFVWLRRQAFASRQPTGDEPSRNESSSSRVDNGINKARPNSTTSSQLNEISEPVIQAESNALQDIQITNYINDPLQVYVICNVCGLPFRDKEGDMCSECRRKAAIAELHRQASVDTKLTVKKDAPSLQHPGDDYEERMKRLHNISPADVCGLPSCAKPPVLRLEGIAYCLGHYYDNKAEGERLSKAAKLLGREIAELKTIGHVAQSNESNRTPSQSHSQSNNDIQNLPVQQSGLTVKIGRRAGLPRELPEHNSGSWTILDDAVALHAPLLLAKPLKELNVRTIRDVLEYSEKQVQKLVPEVDASIVREFVEQVIAVTSDAVSGDSLRSTPIEDVKLGIRCGVRAFDPDDESTWDFPSEYPTGLSQDIYELEGQILAHYLGKKDIHSLGDLLRFSERQLREFTSDVERDPTWYLLQHLDEATGGDELISRDDEEESTQASSLNPAAMWPFPSGARPE
jgi:hypothetical protein